MIRKQAGPDLTCSREAWLLTEHCLFCLCSSARKCVPLSVLERERLYQHLSSAPEHWEEEVGQNRTMALFSKIRAGIFSLTSEGRAVLTKTKEELGKQTIRADVGVGGSRDKGGKHMELLSPLLSQL